MTSHPKNHRILVADDAPTNRELLRSILETEGYQVVTAENGAQALDAALQNPPDLVLLDINMPKMNGYAVCQNLKANPQTAEIPVLFISAMDDTPQKLDAFAAGGVDFIPNPLGVAEVTARVNIHLRIRQMQLDLEEKNRQLEKKNRQLTSALASIKTLQGLIPICAKCKKIRDDDGFWQQVEIYVGKHSDAEFSHGICPDCMAELYPVQYPGKAGDHV